MQTQPRNRALSLYTQNGTLDELDLPNLSVTHTDYLRPAVPIKTSLARKTSSMDCASRPNIFRTTSVGWRRSLLCRDRREFPVVSETPTVREIIEALGGEVGRTIRYVQITDEQWADAAKERINPHALDHHLSHLWRSDGNSRQTRRAAATRATSSAPASGINALPSPHGKNALSSSATLRLTSDPTFSKYGGA
jgi:hypothetical protein